MKIEKNNGEGFGFKSIDLKHICYCLASVFVAFMIFLSLQTYILIYGLKSILEPDIEDIEQARVVENFDNGGVK